MKSNSTKNVLAGAVIAATIAIVAACSGSSMSSTSPTGPSASVASSGANFSPNPDACPLPLPWITDPVDQDGCVCPPPNIFDAGPPETCFPPKDPPPDPPGKEGCTPGFWKANVKKGATEWALAGFSPGQTVGSAGFVAGSFGADTLLEALEYGGGSGVEGATQILLRAAVAALLNAANPTVDYPLSGAAIIAAVNAAIATGDRDTILDLAGQLDADNNLGCPLDNSGSIVG